MKGRLFLLLFSLPFLGVGLWMLWSAGSDLDDAWQMRSWTAVDAQLHSGGYETHAGDDTDTWKAFARYEYEFGGRRYAGTRVAIVGGADNVGDFQRELGRRLERAAAEGRSITVWVNPADPAEAVVDRSVRWGLVGFKAIFVIAFGGGGAAMFAWALLASGAVRTSEAERAARPWLGQSAWQGGPIRSGSKQAAVGTWLFAILWNAISAPVPFVAWDELVHKQNLVVLVGLLFPLIGLFLIGRAVRQTREWRRLGAAPVALDPFPGAIGGHVGGTVDLRLPFDAALTFSLTLTCLKSAVSGSGKNRSRHEQALWQDSRVAHAEPAAGGTRLSFRFDVPPGLAAADAVRDGDDYHLWRLNLNCPLPGVDIDRDYDIPVYPTGEHSQRLPERIVASARDRQDAIDDAAVRGLLQVSSDFAGKRIYFPAGRNAGHALVGSLFGGTFAVAGWFLVTAEGERLIGGAFGAVGLAVLFASLYAALNSLEVTADALGLRSVRRVLGLPVRRRHMRRADIAGLRRASSGQSQSGSRHEVRYTIYADDRHGNSMVVGEGFRGDGQARAATRLLTREFGLPESAGSARTAGANPGADVDDVLAADR